MLRFGSQSGAVVLGLVIAALAPGRHALRPEENRRARRLQSKNRSVVWAEAAIKLTDTIALAGAATPTVVGARTAPNGIAPVSLGSQAVNLSSRGPQLDIQTGDEGGVNAPLAPTPAILGVGASGRASHAASETITAGIDASGSVSRWARLHHKRHREQSSWTETETVMQPPLALRPLSSTSGPDGHAADDVLQSSVGPAPVDLLTGMPNEGRGDAMDFQDQLTQDVIVSGSNGILGQDSQQAPSGSVWSNATVEMPQEASGVAAPQGQSVQEMRSDVPEAAKLCESDGHGWRTGCRGTCSCPWWQRCYKKKDTEAPFVDFGVCDMSMRTIVVITILVFSSLVLFIIVARLILQEREFLRRHVDRSSTRTILARGQQIAKKLADRRATMRLSRAQKAGPPQTLDGSNLVEKVRQEQAAKAAQDASSSKSSGCAQG